MKQAKYDAESAFEGEFHDANEDLKEEEEEEEFEDAKEEQEERGTKRKREVPF